MPKGARWSAKTVCEVKDLRLKGATYREIIKKLGIPKSTLSEWCKKLPVTNHLYFSDRKSWLREIRKLSAISKKKNREKKLKRLSDEAKIEVNNWNLDSLMVGKLIISMLYWAEGQKLPEKGAIVKFANTDPRMILLFLTLLRKCYKIDESKLRIGLHIHWYHDPKKIQEYWGKLLSIDASRFHKPYVKLRSKTKRFRKNFAGICYVVYYSVDLQKEIVATGYNIAEKVIGNNYLRP